MYDLANLPQPVIRYGVGLWRRRWIVVIVAWLSALAMWAAIWLIPDNFSSQGKIFIQTDNILEPVMSDITARPDYERRVEVMQRALLTRQNIERVILRAGLDKIIEADAPDAYRVELENLIDWVGESIRIDSPQQMFFDVKYTFRDPVLTRNVVDAVLDLFIEQDLGASLQENEDATRKLDLEIKRFEERLTAKDQEVARFRRENAEELALISGNQRRREQLELDLSNVANELAIAKRRLSTLTTQLASTPRSTTGDELGKLKVQLARLRSQYQDNYPEIQDLLAQIRELENASAGALPDNPEYGAVRNQLAAARDQVAALEERERTLRGEMEALSFTLSQAPQVEADLQRILRDYEQTQKSYEDLVQSRDRLQLTTTLGPGAQGVKYQVLERPRVALKPVSPPRLVLIVGSIVAAFGFGAAAAMALTFLDKSYSQTQVLQAAFGLPVLGAISIVSSDAVKAAHRTDIARLAGVCGALIVLCAAYIYWEVFRVPATASAAPSEAAAPAGDIKKDLASWG